MPAARAGRSTIRVCLEVVGRRAVTPGLLPDKAPCFAKHRRHKKEVAGPIPVSNCLRTAKVRIPPGGLSFRASAHIDRAERVRRRTDEAPPFTKGVDGGAWSVMVTDLSPRVTRFGESRAARS